jgi:acyl dehydratase
MVRKYFEDCRVGDRAVTPGRTITETDVVFFAAFTGDWMPLHTDAEYARRSVFGERIAHGMLVLTVGYTLLHRLGEFTLLPESTITNEIERVRFRVPTRIGDTLHMECEVSRMRELDSARGIIITKGYIKNQRGETVVSLTMKALVGRRAVG